MRSFTKTFVSHRRTIEDPFKIAVVDVDDYCMIQLQLKSGGIGLLEASRFATGSSNQIIFKIYGAQGALKFDLTNSNYLYYYDIADPKQPLGGYSGFKAIQTIQQYPDCSFGDPLSEAGWMRYHIASQYYFLQSIVTGKPHEPDLQSGYEIQKVLEAAYQAADNQQDWVQIN